MATDQFLKMSYDLCMVEELRSVTYQWCRVPDGVTTTINEHQMMNEEILTLIGLILAFIGLIYNAEQIRRSRKVALADFLLRLDEQLRHYNDIHIKLHHRGEWANDKGSPQSDEEWIMVEQYMGLFERVQYMIEARIIPLGVFKRLYGYRVTNILKNKEITQEQLVKYKKYWPDFISLARSLKLY